MEIDGFPTVLIFSVTFAETPRKIEISMWKFQFYEGFPQSYDRNFVETRRKIEISIHKQAETLRKIEISMWKSQFYEGFPTVWIFNLQKSPAS